MHIETQPSREVTPIPLLTSLQSVEASICLSKPLSVLRSMILSLKFFIINYLNILSFLFLFYEMFVIDVLFFH